MLYKSFFTLHYISSTKTQYSTNMGQISGIVRNWTIFLTRNDVTIGFEDYVFNCQSVIYSVQCILALYHICLRGRMDRLRAMASSHQESDGPGFKPRGGHGQPNRPSYTGVGKLIAISMQWVTAVDGWEGNSVRLYDGWRTAYAAGDANYRTLVSCNPHGSM
jgi:hypothetical protein